MIREFFVNDHPGPDFSMYGFNHIMVMLLVVAFMAVIYIKRKEISSMDEKKKRKILVTVATLMLLAQIIYFVSNIYFDIFDYKIHLPFHLCFVSNYIFIYAIYYNKLELLKVTYFLAFVGPAAAIFLPEIPSSFDYYKFWEYFFSHHVFIVISFFSYFAYNYKIEKKHAYYAFAFINFMIFTMMPFNIMFDMNYIYSSEIPNYIIEAYPFLKYFNALVALEIGSIAIIYLAYLYTNKRNLELEVNKSKKKKK